MFTLGTLGQYPLGGIGTTGVTILDEATRPTVYAPRPLITLTIGAVTAYYSTETLLAPAGGDYGEDYGDDYGG